MLAYGEIIENLNIDEKLAILTSGDYLSAIKEENVGLPKLSIRSEKDLSKEEYSYPSFEALANSWSVLQTDSVAKGLALRAKRMNVNAMLLPSGTVRGNVYEDGASEDPLLLGTLLGQYAKTMSEKGVMPILSKCEMSPLNAAFADVEPSARAIMEYYLKAFQIAAKESEVAISSSYTRLKGAYESVNTRLVPSLIEKHVAGANSFLICENAESEKEVERLNAGFSLCINGHAHTLKEAVTYYNELKNAVESGVASAEELEEAIEKGAALSEDTVDEAVDRVLRFAQKCETYAQLRGKDAQEPSEAELLKIAESTAVLLKNKQETLPLARRRKIAVIGELSEDGGDASALSYLTQTAGKDFVGYGKGYDLTRNRSDDLIASACAIAQKAETVVVFLGLGEKREDKLTQTRKLKLPGSQAALLEKLARLGKKIVAVVKGSGRLDMSFDNIVDAVLYMPDAGYYGGQAIARLLYGNACPCGKLPFTMYSEPEERAAKERFYKNGGYNKVGTFVGYRRYDSDRELVKYPFGHGLSYTKFTYSNLRVSNKKVWLTVKNTGHREGTEIVQFYYGKDKAMQIRPRKQLFGFSRITLRPGEERSVSIEIPPKAFAFYNPQTSTWEVESGPYKVYASSSVVDEKLKCFCYETGTSPTPSKEKTSEYLQGKSNIVSGEFFMDTKIQRTQYKPKGILFGVITILLAVLLDAFLIVFGEEVDFFHEDLGEKVGWILFIVCNFLCLLGILAMIVSHKNKKRFNRESTQKALVRKTEEKEKAVSPVSYEQLFIEEFSELLEDEDEEEAEKDAHEEYAFAIKEKVDGYHQDGWTLYNMQDELTAFLLKRGVVLDALQARTILSAMSVSRLVVLKTDTGVDPTAFMRAMSEFFAVKPYIDNAEKYQSSDDMLFAETTAEEESEYAYRQTAFADAMDEAEADECAIKLAHLTSVRLEALGGYFTQFMRYIVKPELSYSVAMKNKSVSDKSFTITPNLWIFIAIAEEEKAERLPAYVAEAAAFVKLRFSLQSPSEEQTERKPISKAQFVSFGDKAKNRFELDESRWKRVDRLEEYVCARTSYQISNKVWQKMEKYASVFLSLGGEEDEALDSVVAVKLLTNILALVKHNKKENDDQFFHVLENIFGEEKANICRAVVDASSVDVDDKWIEESKADKPKKSKDKTVQAEEIIQAQPVEREEKTVEGDNE